MLPRCIYTTDIQSAGYRLHVPAYATQFNCFLFEFLTVNFPGLCHVVRVFRVRKLPLTFCPVKCGRFKTLANWSGFFY